MTSEWEGYRPSLFHVPSLGHLYTSDMTTTTSVSTPLTPIV